uniref:Uncharacterized protein n=1 Tax=Anguilla anguilla TaxID=7936 RepID=A0A0E9PCX3_ANGAN
MLRSSLDFHITLSSGYASTF